MKTFFFRIIYLIIIAGFLSPYFGRPELANVSAALMSLFIIFLVLTSFFLIGLGMLRGHSYENFHQKLKANQTFSNPKRNSLVSKWTYRVLHFTVVCAAAYSGYVFMAVVFALAMVFAYSSVKFLESVHNDWLEFSRLRDTLREDFNKANPQNPL